MEIEVGRGEVRLREAIRRFRDAQNNSVPEARPPAVYCLLTGEDVDDLAEELRELKAVMRNVYVSDFLVLVGLIADVVLRSVGAKLRLFASLRMTTPLPQRRGERLASGHCLE